MRAQIYLNNKSQFLEEDEKSLLAINESHDDGKSSSRRPVGGQNWDLESAAGKDAKSTKTPRSQSSRQPKQASQRSKEDIEGEFEEQVLDLIRNGLASSTCGDVWVDLENASVD